MRTVKVLLIGSLIFLAHIAVLSMAAFPLLNARDTLANILGVVLIAGLVLTGSYAGQAIYKHLTKGA